MVHDTMFVKKRWDDEGHADSSKEASYQGMSHPDFNLVDLEVRTLLQHLPSSGKVLDAGCGAGHASLCAAREKSLDIVGIDFSDGMIHAAQQNLANVTLTSSTLTYRIGNVMQLPFADASFDCVYSIRCLINLSSWDDQQKALCEILRVLKKGGTFLLIDGSVDGLANLNRLRHEFGLSPIPVVWHNLFFHDAQLLDFFYSLSTAVEVVSFASTYMLFSRAIQPFVVAPQEPRYNSDINLFGKSLPSQGDYGYEKLWVVTK